MRTVSPPRPSEPSSAPNQRITTIVYAVLTAGAFVAFGVASTPPAEAATITAAYGVGHRDVRINDYGTSGLGTFLLRGDPGDPFEGERLALCIEADVSHSTATNRYHLVPNRIDSPQLDYLLWKFGWPGTEEYTELGNDRDTATALAAVAWYYSGASRRHGGPVWANPADGFSPVSPVAPHRWDDLPAYTTGFPIGMRSGVHHLDGAERRVYELFVEAEERRGPWTMSEIHRDDGRAHVAIRGPAGPIAHVGGVRFVVRTPDGAIVSNSVVSTDGDGSASVDLAGLPSGGSIEVSMYAPGVHQEWDGPGDVQRMATATNTSLHRSTIVPPQPVHIQVDKHTSDPAFEVAGATFALVDSRRRTVTTATSDPDGSARFEPIDPAVHPGPYIVRELVAPDGLSPSIEDHAVPDPASIDRERPSVVIVTNDPIPHRLVVRKRLSDSHMTPPDLSGFVFEIERLADDRSFGAASTGPDGATDPVTVTEGTFRICEREGPGWAERLLDPGCVLVDVSADAPETIELDYTNLVPSPSIDTRVRWQASSPTTGITFEPAVVGPDDGRLIDTVTYRDLVPGIEYELVGELHRLDLDPHGEGIADPSGLEARISFVPDTPDGSIDLSFEFPADVRIGSDIDVGVVYQRLFVGDELVAAHADPEAITQRFWVPHIETNATLDANGLVDRVAYRGLPPGPAEARLVWHERSTDGTCRPLDLGTTHEFDVDTHAGEIVVGPIATRDDLFGRTLVAFQEIWTVSDEDAAPMLLAVHADCDAASQTVVLDPLPVDDQPVTVPPTTAPPTTTSTSTSSTTTTTSTSTTTTVAASRTTAVSPTPGPRRHRLPSTGVAIDAVLGIALMSFGAGGLALTASAVARRR